MKEYAEVPSQRRLPRGHSGIWTVKCDVALPCATQNELDAGRRQDAGGKRLLRRGRGCQHAHLLWTRPTYLQEHGILFCPGKASNAGGVATSALEMSQNSERLSWTFEEVDAKLQEHHGEHFPQCCDNAAKEYGMEGNYVAGANIAGFLKVADAMTAQGIV